MQKLKDINLVIASGSEAIQNTLQELLAKHGANIVLCGFLNSDFVNRLENNIVADVILIDMDDSYEEDTAALDQLLEKIDLPILFHDNDSEKFSDANDENDVAFPGIKKLVAKLAQLVNAREIKDKSNTEKSSTEKSNTEKSNTEKSINNVQIENKNSIEKLLVLENNYDSDLTEEELLEVQLWDMYSESSTTEPLVDVSELSAKEPSARKEPSAEIEPSAKIEPSENQEPSADKLKNNALLFADKSLQNPGMDIPADLLNVWVLGASIGGPEAVKRFLARIPGELPVAFVLAQHLGDGFVSLLAEQLDRISSFHVKEGNNGDTLRHGEVLVVPVDNRMALNEKGQIIFIDDDWTGLYKPSIDCVIDDVTSHFKSHSGVIIFSGMGADGVLASQRFSEKYNGNIWAQSADTCVISSMPDSVRKENMVSFSGSPEALAVKISVHFMGKESYIL